MVNKLRVKRKGFRVKPTTFKRKGKVIHRRGFKVKATSFLIKDLGKKGRAKKVIPNLRRGSLGVSFSSLVKTRRKKLVMLAKRIGEKKVIGKLRAVQVFNKRTNPSLSRKALMDSRFIAGAFRRKRFVGVGRGFGGNK